MCVLMTRKGALHTFQEIALAFINTRKLKWKVSLRNKPWCGFNRASKPFSVDMSHPAFHTSLTSPQALLAFLTLSSAKAARHISAYRALGAQNASTYPQSDNRIAGEKAWRKIRIYDCYSCSWPHIAGDRRREVLPPSLSKGCSGRRKHKFCHLQTILHLGRAAAWKAPVEGTAIQLILKPKSRAMQSSAEKEPLLAQSRQH